MRGLRRTNVLKFVLPMALLFHSHDSSAQVIASRYTWLLPKTVIDATIAYTFVDCTGNKLKLKIVPTLAPRTVPDTLVGAVSIATGSLDSFGEDRNVSIQTFADSHILSSIGSNPVNQVSQIVGNILGGVAKLVGISLGGSLLNTIEFTKNAKNPSPQAPPPPPDPQCGGANNPAQVMALKIKDLKKKIADYQADLANGVNEDAQKKDNAGIQAAQTLIASLQDQLTITIKTTIDPGVSLIDVDPDNDTTQSPGPQSAVQEDGQIAKICPSMMQLKDAKWFDNLADIFPNPTTIPRPHCGATPYLAVNVYMDFPNGMGTRFDVRGEKFTHNGNFPQTVVGGNDLYREASHIPVLVWRGDKAAAQKQALDKDDPPTGPVQLIAPQMVPFGQFGVTQALPLTADLFKSLSWQITFLETGEITAANFTSKSSGVVATNLLGTAISAANSIATEQRSAASPSNQASAVQSQADLIYQSQRLALCQISPSSCTSK